MNAYELADDLEGWCDDVLSNQNRKNVFKKHANMLRQQADRIAELEKQGEPVAWIRSGDDQLSLVKEKDDGYMVWKPLYLAPQTKPLSDADIEEISHEYHYTYNPDYVGFARAIEERHGIK